MTKRLVLLSVLAAAMVLALSVSSCRKSARSPNDFKNQYEKVTPGMDAQKMLALMNGFMMVRANLDDGDVEFMDPAGPAGGTRAIFHMKDNKVVSKDFEILPLPPSKPWEAPTSEEKGTREE